MPSAGFCATGAAWLYPLPQYMVCSFCQPGASSFFSFLPLPLHSSWCESFIVNTNKLFLPSPSWQQLRFLQHQMAMAAAAAQAAHLHHQQHSGSHSKSKRKRGTPAPPKSWDLPPPKKLIQRGFFFRLLRRRLKIKLVFYITCGKMNFWHYTKRNELILEANLTELKKFIYKVARVWFPQVT